MTASEKKVKATLREFYRKQLKRGFEAKYLEETLLKRGFPKKAVKDVSREFSKKKYYKNIGMDKSHFKKILASKSFFLIALFLVIIITVSLWITVRVNDDCETMECFILNANQCKNSNFMYNDEGIVFKFESSYDCSVKKSVIELPANEPFAIRQLVLNTEMTCYYEENNFDEMIITSLLEGMDNCEGTLKDALYKIAIAQYEVQLEEESLLLE